ncbi:DUF6358 family protein [Mucilaginibacter sp. X5P1]|uniref:DUF6358 family protein n=1 Tax=Mucilaginibacter sp. X5P1 TaxID=2723088 RepID=UPI00161825E9|nr:DUF6358 family protein [Mucilaginibacter sp. X5P1]MBB6139376.1 hypothetical protein [Mucilaginibacter sp. X5P1]
MFKKAMLNTMYTVGIAGCIVLGYLAFDKRSFVLIFLAIFALVFFVMQKIKLLKAIKNLKKP